MKDQSSVLRHLKIILDAPTGTEELKAWLDLESALAFIDGNAQTDSLIINMSAAYLYLVSALIPNDRLGDRKDGNDFLDWNYDPESTWGLCASANEVWIENGFSGAGSKSLEGGEPIIIRRSFEGASEYRTYFELCQRFAHVMGLHFVSERKAWCRLDRHGDIEDVVQIIDISEKSSGVTGRIVLCDRETLARYAELTRLTFIQMFDVTYFEVGSFTSWNQDSFENRTYGSLCYRYGKGARAAFARGFKLIPLAASRQQILADVWGRNAEKQYESYITFDRKHSRIIETSCDPSETDSYFVDTGKPWQVSPVFFRPEVLLKYKGDREKYRLAHRTISCRGSWSLQTFDINDEGQVHTYLTYLSDLPHSEQLHWKQYNEHPKGPISERAHQTDIVGNFWDGYDPLVSLQRKLRKLEEGNCPWWSARNEDLVDKTYYPVTSSFDEWADELLNLSQLLVEGLKEQFLRTNSGERDPKLRSLSLLEKCLIKIGFEQTHAGTLVQPLRDLQNLRNRTKGHAGGSEAKALRIAAVKEHGSLQAQFRFLVQQCDESFDTIIRAFKDHW